MSFLTGCSPEIKDLIRALGIDNVDRLISCKIDIRADAIVLVETQYLPAEGSIDAGAVETILSEYQKIDYQKL